MMTFNLVSLFPSMFEALSQKGVISKAIEKSKIKLEYVNPRNFAKDKHRTVDDKPYGGSDGMLLLSEPLKGALSFLDKKEGGRGYVVYLSPQGEKWTHKKALQWSETKKVITFVCGRYGGIDQRFIETYVDEEISAGDYILSGGELPAMILIDSLTRLLPEVLGNADSKFYDSFSSLLLEAPQYTRPVEFEGLRVPDVLLSGNHEKIKKWKKQISLIKTFQLRSDLIQERVLEEKMRLMEDLNEAFKEASNWSEEDRISCGLNNLSDLKKSFEFYVAEGYNSGKN